MQSRTIQRGVYLCPIKYIRESVDDARETDLQSYASYNPSQSQHGKASRKLRKRSCLTKCAALRCNQDYGRGAKNIAGSPYLDTPPMNRSPCADRRSTSTP